MNRPKSMHPSGLSWRERQIQKEKDRVAEEALRKETERLEKLKVTDDNFPALSFTPKTKIVPETKSKLFSSLASEWKEHEELEKMKREREEEEARKRELMYRPTLIRRVRHESDYENYYGEDDEEESHTPKYGYEEERWTTVEYKHKDPRQKYTIRYHENIQEDEEDYEQNADIQDYPARDY